ncbi:MAG TPA: hypothetical protein VK212_07440 [Lentimicrobium sp.]|nr:hypothetical protein [Lentimicrobium sp.]
MKLAISLYFRNNVPFLELVDRDLSWKVKRSRKVLSLHKLTCNNSIANLFRTEQEDLLTKLTDNQLTVAIYFYLKHVVPSQQIIRYWLFETMDNEEHAIKIANLVYEAVINDLDQDPLELEYFIEDYVAESSNDDIIYPEDISVALDVVRKGGPIRWRFDDHFEYQGLVESNINISDLKETLFQIEDHSSLIVGLSNSASSMIELITGYKTGYLEKLCNLIPIGLRDIYSVGSCLVAFPALRDIIITNGIKNIELMGMDTNGILRKYQKDQAQYFNYSNIKTNDIHESFIGNSYLPLFLKLNK